MNQSTKVFLWFAVSALLVALAVAVLVVLLIR